MTVEMRERSLSVISKVIGLSFASSAYKAFRSISAKHHGNRVMDSPVYLAGNVARRSKIEGQTHSHGSCHHHHFITPLEILAGTGPVKSFIVVMT